MNKYLALIVLLGIASFCSADRGQKLSDARVRKLSLDMGSMMNPGMNTGGFGMTTGLGMGSMSNFAGVPGMTNSFAGGFNPGMGMTNGFSGMTGSTGFTGMTNGMMPGMTSTTGFPGMTNTGFPGMTGTTGFPGMTNGMMPGMNNQQVKPANFRSKRLGEAKFNQVQRNKQSRSVKPSTTGTSGMMNNNGMNMMGGNGMGMMGMGMMGRR